MNTLETWWSVLYREVSSFQEPLYCGHLGDLLKCPVYRGILISGVSFKRGSTVVPIHRTYPTDTLSLACRPEDVPRLFDLVQIQEPRFQTAFYFALRNTLVARDLDQATRIGLQGRSRHRVVTLGGQLVDVSGMRTLCPFAKISKPCMFWRWGERSNERGNTIGIGWGLLASATSGFSGYISFAYCSSAEGFQ